MPKLRILVVEDDGVIAMLLSDLLEQLGHEVCAVEATEAGAVAAAERSNPDLMIVDDHLREGCGQAVVKTVLLTRHVPHIFVTGDPAGVEGLCQDAIMIEKPYNETILIEAISDALANSADLLLERRRSRSEIAASIRS